MKASHNRLLSLGPSFLIFLVILYFSYAPLVRQFKITFLFSKTANQSHYIKAPYPNLWADLTPEEARDLTSFLHSREEFNLTSAKKATIYDNAIRVIEILQPNKTDVLLFLNGTSKHPKRWARVAVNYGAGPRALITNYMVSLPPTSASEIRSLEYCFNSDRNYVLNPLPDPALLEGWGFSLGVNISDVTEELFGDKLDPMDPASLGAVATFSYVEDGTYFLWLQVYREGTRSDATTLLPQGLYVKLEIPTRDPETWVFHQIHYNEHTYDSIHDLRKAMKSPDFRKAPLNIDGPWTDIEDFGDGLPGRGQAAPVMVQPQGNRFRLDKKERFVSWMGFEFFISTSSDTGAALHDIRFNGDRIIYELGLQEALAHYAGNDPQQSGLEYLDTTFLMGLQMTELVPGYDCPAYAEYLSTSYHGQDDTITKKNSMCIFEYTADHALQRHTSEFMVSISRNTYLIFRHIPVLGNYDYTIDYIFYLDGTLEVKVRASGFIFAAFFASTLEEKREYGYKVHDAVATSMHDHVLNFKADLDILGTDNTMVRVGIEPVTLEYPWDDEYTSPRNTMHLIERVVDKETGLDWPRNAGEMLVVRNENFTNAWGEKRGYRITPGTGVGNPSHLTIVNSTMLGTSAEWAMMDLWAVKQKDTEPKAGSALNYFEPRNPLIDFSKFVDGEDIENEDLVVFFNLGNHHVPHSGDIPNTLMHTSASSVMFTPFNFHDRDESRKSVQGVRLDKRPKGSKPKYFGGTYDEGFKVKTTDVEPDLSKFDTEQYVAKTNWSWIPGLVVP